MHRCHWVSELSHRECASTFGRIIETSMSAFGSEEWFILSLEKSFQVLSVLILLVYGNIPYYPIYMFLILNIYLGLCMNSYLEI